ncbi:MAG: putative toxin-antitoxin system toxin component, PIN family [Candidatus Bipolaricaulia bacterium]
MKILLDTNTLFSGLGFEGNERNLLKKAGTGEVDFAVTDMSFEELKRNISEKYSERQREEALDLLLTILSTGRIEIKGKDAYQKHLDEAKEMINEEDTPILAAAMLGDIDILVTGDKDFLENHQIKLSEKIRVKRTKEILEQLEEAEEA